MIDVDDSVYSFNEVLRHIDLRKYFVEEEDHKTGRPGYDGEKLLKVILFAFMEEGYQATRVIQKLCRTDIRFLWLLDGERGPSHMTICNFINKQLKDKIEDIFQDISKYIFEKELVDLSHIYIDGTIVKLKNGEDFASSVKKYHISIRFYSAKNHCYYANIHIKDAIVSGT